MKKLILFFCILFSALLIAQFAPPSTSVDGIAFDGNSMLVYGNDVLGGHRTPTSCMALLPQPKRVYHNFAIGGRQTPFLTAEFDTKVAPSLRPGDIVIFWEITNSAHYRIGDTNGDTLYSEVVAYCNKVRSYGFKIYVLTAIPRYMAGFDDINITSRINACNVQLRANWATFCDGLIDIAATPTFSAATSYTNSTYYESDGTHLKNRGCDSVAYKIYREIPH